eukprot:3412450-Pyramimonas_sp.AAC.1
MCNTRPRGARQVRDLRNWLTVYSYWNEGGTANVAEAFLYLTDQYLFPTAAPQQLQETPPTGVYHPQHAGYFASAGDYLKWHRKASDVPADAPVVAVLLYR